MEGLKRNTLLQDCVIKSPQQLNTLSCGYKRESDSQRRHKDIHSDSGTDGDTFFGATLGLRYIENGGVGS